MNTTDYSATGAQRVAAGIWPWNVKILYSSITSATTT